MEAIGKSSVWEFLDLYFCSICVTWEPWASVSTSLLQQVLDQLTPVHYDHPQGRKYSLFFFIVLDIIGTNLVNMSESYLYLLLKHIFTHTPITKKYHWMEWPTYLALLNLIIVRILWWNYYYHHYVAGKKTEAHWNYVTLCVCQLYYNKKALRY